MKGKKAIGDYSAKWTSISIQPGTAGDMICQGNFEGTMGAYGSMLGTLTCTPAGHKAGTFQSHVVTFPADGGVVTGTARGTFELVAPMRWRTVGLMTDSNGRTAIGDGEINLEKKTWTGKLYEAG